MQSTQSPTLVPLPFAANGQKNTIPEASQISITPGAASLNDGFPPLTMIPRASGGIAPSGFDFNGILNLITQSIRWAHGGGTYTWNSGFASDSNVGGYPKGSVLARADLTGFWLNTVENNATNPDATDGSAAGWVPGYNYGVTTITGLTNANVTLSPLQAAKGRIVLSGTLTGSINVVFPAWTKEWQVVNNTTGAFTITAKTAAGTGIVLPAGQTKITGDGTNITQPVENIATAPTNDNSGAGASTGWLWSNIQALVSSCIAAVATAAGFSLTASYVKFPTWLGGLIFQWGQISVGTSDTALVFPLAFTNGVNYVGAFPNYTGNGVFAVYNSLSLTGVSFGTWATNSTRAAAFCYWLAIGK
ncbi:phage tail protein [Burkholderia gladioli]|uniref:gp53-like domain-containing protein n=1 Tax=Burkholderia gladioli TaxID=28095 RepID=UPI000CDA4B37|nr:phage tail protein [Burkholderia gladioli]POS10238.1 phage tail protein [Burkholderia gladioli]